MLSYSIAFIFLAIVAAFYGFRDHGGTVEPIARIVFFLFATVAFVTAWIGRTPAEKSSGSTQEDSG